MKPLFTIHAGEYLAASYIEQNFNNCRIWIPSEDTGIDLLVTDRKHQKALSLQVKFSKDFTHSHMPDFYKDKLITSTWFKFDRPKILRSKADYWLFVFRPFAEYASRFMLIKPKKLLQIITKIHGNKEIYALYFSVTKQGTCWETRGLKDKDRREIISGSAITRTNRNFTRFLDNWKAVQAINI